MEQRAKVHGETVKDGGRKSKENTEMERTEFTEDWMGFGTVVWPD
jgi:hypothetical protein